MTTNPNTNPNPKQPTLKQLQRRADRQLVAWCAAPRGSREWWARGTAFVSALNDCRRLQGFAPLRLSAYTGKEATR